MAPGKVVSGALGYDPSANAGEADRSVGETMLTSVVLGEERVAALVGAYAAFSEFTRWSNAAAEPVSFKCVSHGMAS